MKNRQPRIFERRTLRLDARRGVWRNNVPKSNEDVSAPTISSQSTRSFLDGGRSWGELMNHEEEETSVYSNETDCYLSLSSFNDFQEICDLRHYRSLPGDWVVIVADVAGSTALVETGRYRDVNTVGAMSIVAIRNAIGDNFPYVFGGDGASMVVRPEQKEKAITVALALQRLVSKNYEMHLRVGCVPVSKLEDMGAEVKVARYEVSAETTIAMFAGRGLAMADSIIKSGEELEQTPESRRVEPNLSGLSCRWNKVPNRNGCVLSLLVSTFPGVSGEEERQIYSEVLEKLAEIFTLKDANPANMDAAQYKKAGDMIREEKRMYGRRFANLAWVNRAAEIRLCHVLFHWRKLQKSIIDVPAYMDTMRAHTDYRKFDDMVRMVVDCTDEQVQEIESTLEAFHREGKICFGLHKSTHCLMTCLVEDAQTGKHLHFVDGDAGGYTLAAKQLKRQQSLNTKDNLPC